MNVTNEQDQFAWECAEAIRDIENFNGPDKMIQLIPRLTTEQKKVWFSTASLYAIADIIRDLSKVYEPEQEVLDRSLRIVGYSINESNHCYEEFTISDENGGVYDKQITETINLLIDMGAKITSVESRTIELLVALWCEEALTVLLNAGIEIPPQYLDFSIKVDKYGCNFPMDEDEWKFFQSIVEKRRPRNVKSATKMS